MSRTTVLRRFFVLCLCPAMFSVTGCGKKEMPVYPVKGQVVAGDEKKPAVGAILFFNPVQKELRETGRPMAEVDADGRFSLTTRAANDGAPAGEYVITIIWPPARKTIFEQEEDDRLGGAFADAKTSTIRFTVQAMPTNQVPVIELP